MCVCVCVCVCVCFFVCVCVCVLFFFFLGGGGGGGGAQACEMIFIKMHSIEIRRGYRTGKDTVCNIHAFFSPDMLQGEAVKGLI